LSFFPIGAHIQIDVKDDKAQDHLHTDLAPAYGTLKNDGMKEMDERLKVIIAVGMTELAKLSPEEKTWETIMSILENVAVLEPDGEPVSRTDQLLKSSSQAFDFDEGAIDQGVVKEVHIPTSPHFVFANDTG
jgi:hypothetical protein